MKDDETIEDILKELREEAGANCNAEWLLKLSDRIEAAFDRFVDEDRRVSDAVIKALRDERLKLFGEVDGEVGNG